MVKPSICLAAYLIMMLLISCHADEAGLSKSGYIIFGHFYGECSGERCVEIFRLEQERLFEDTKDEYPNGGAFYEGNYVQLSQQKFESTKDLIGAFPTDLLYEKNTVLGQPDAGDWGGLYIEYNFNGVRKFWLVDQMKSNVPAKYHNFMAEVNEKITQLQ